MQSTNIKNNEVWIEGDKGMHVLHNREEIKGTRLGVRREERGNKIKKRHVQELNSPS